MLMNQVQDMHGKPHTNINIRSLFLSLEVHSTKNPAG